MPNAPAPAIGDRLEATGARVGRAVDTAGDRTLREVQPLLETRLLHVGGLNVTLGGLVAAALVLLGVWFASRLMRRTLRRYGERHAQTNPAVLYTISRVLHYVLLALGFLWAMDLAGVPLGKFGLFASAVGVGLGFGLQAIFSNFISGLILLFDRSLKVGDFVELPNGARGEVRDIKIRATRITTNDNIDILVPNSEFINGNVVNWTHRDVSRRLRIPFAVAYGTDKERVREAGLEAAAELPFTLTGHETRKAQVWLVGFGESALKFELVVWLTPAATKRPAAVEAAYFWALHGALQRHGIGFPYAQRDLHIRSLFGREEGSARDFLRELAGVDDETLARHMALRAREAAAPKHRHADANDAVAEVERQMAADAHTPRAGQPPAEAISPPLFKT